MTDLGQGCRNAFVVVVVVVAAAAVIIVIVVLSLSCNFAAI